MRAVLKVAIAAVAVVVAVEVLAGHTAELSGAESILENIDPGWVAGAVAVEFVSYLAYALAERELLLVGGVSASMTSLTGISLAGNAIQNSFPGGPAWAGIYAFRQFRRLGADAVVATWALVATALTIDVALVLLAAVGILAAGSSAGASLVVPIVASAVVFVVLLYAISRRSTWIQRAAVACIRTAIRAWGRVTRRDRSDAEQRARAAWQDMRQLRPTGREWGAALGFGVANWLTDLGCLVCAIAAVRSGIPWRGLLLAYGAGQLAATLPITPGGLGVVEGSLTVALVAFGGHETRMVAAVLLYRMISFWLMLVVGWSAWGIIRFRARGDVPS